VKHAEAVYMFGLRVTGFPALPGSPTPPRAGAPRAVELSVVEESALSERWQPREPRRIVERRLADGSLVLAVDEDPTNGYLIEAPEVGVHLVSSDGGEVLLAVPQGPDWFWQRLLFAQTLPIAAALQGLGLFHASAVRIADRAVGVSAPSGTGKSSTATHLIAQGAEFLTDDVLALDVVDGAVIAFAGPEFANVEAHELSAVDPGRRERLGPLLGASAKQHLRPALTQTSLPLGALYLLERRAGFDELRIEALHASGIPTLLAGAFIPHLGTDRRLVGHLELCGQMVTDGQIFRVLAPLHGSAAAVAAAVMDHARTRFADGS
jgi:hypothetical protein